MTRQEMLKMFELDKPAPAPKAGAGIGITTAIGMGETATDRPPSSVNAVKVDEWGARRGRDLVAESDRLRELNHIDEVAAADFHAVAFDPSPELVESCTDTTRHEFLKQLLETPEYRALHEDTMLDEVASEIAATSFAEQFAALKTREEDRPGKGKVKRKAGPVGKAEKPGKDDGMEREMEVLRAVGRAVAEADDEVRELKETQAALGMGKGDDGVPMDPRRVADIFRRVRNDPRLRKICELAGRFRRVAQSKQRTKATHGMDDLVGVHPDGDLGRLLPVELAKLAVPELELDTLRRLVERQTLCREYQSVEPAARGPIIVAIDESGSMMGDKANTAKAIALALAWVARQQRRWVGLVAYSGDSGERVLALPPGRWNEEELMVWLVEFIGRGSEIDIPVREMPRMYRDLKAPEGKTDVLFITDAVCSIPGPIKDRFNAWKKEVKARLITLVIDSGYLGDGPGRLRSIADISDEAHVVPSLDATEEGVERALSI